MTLSVYQSKKNSLEKSRLENQNNSAKINGAIRQARKSMCPAVPPIKISGTRDKPKNNTKIHSIFYSSITISTTKKDIKSKVPKINVQILTIAVKWVGLCRNTQTVIPQAIIHTTNTISSISITLFLSIFCLLFYLLGGLPYLIYKYIIANMDIYVNTFLKLSGTKE